MILTDCPEREGQYRRAGFAPHGLGQLVCKKNLTNLVQYAKICLCLGMLCLKWIFP